MSEQGLVGLVSEWRKREKSPEPGKKWADMDGIECADELAPFLDQLTALEQDLASFRANCEHDQPHFGDFAARLGRLLRGEREPAEASNDR